jgi:hypothetical protein
MPKKPRVRRVEERSELAGGWVIGNWISRFSKNRIQAGKLQIRDEKYFVLVGPIEIILDGGVTRNCGVISRV